MTNLLIRKILISLAALHTTYTALIVGLYVDITERIRYPVIRILWTIGICTLCIAVYYVASSPDVIWEFLPFDSSTVKNYLNSQIMPLVASSIRIMGSIAILVSIIDKLLYLVGDWRMPYPFALLCTGGGMYLAGITIYRILIGPQEAIRELLYQFEMVTPLLIEPLFGIALFLLSAVIYKILRNVVTLLHSPR